MIAVIFARQGATLTFARVLSRTRIDETRAYHETRSRRAPEHQVSMPELTDTSQDSAAKPVDPFAYRRAIGRFPTGVTVVTVVDESAPNAGVNGITANSVSSVSLDPVLLLVSIGKEAKSHDMIARAGRFALSVLASDQEPISDYFADRPVPRPEDPLEEFAGHPVVRGALSQLVCELHAAVAAGDHTVYIGRVVALRSREDGTPLIYYRGDYRATASAALDEE